MTAGSVSPRAGARIRAALSLEAIGERETWTGIAILLTLRIVLSLHNMLLPGLEQDETLFVNAATVRIPGIDIPDAWGRVPLMVFPYIGALKSWLYYPIFKIFPVTATSIRLPAVLIVCGGLALIYPAVRDLSNRLVAILAFTFLCFDNSVLWLTRDDVGPSALEFALKCVVLFCAARMLRRPRRRWLGLLLATLALGVWNKLNFIWIINASLAVSVLVMIWKRRSLRKSWRLVVAWVAGLGLIYGAFGWYYLANHIGDIRSGRAGGLHPQPWYEFSAGVSHILSGTWYYAYALDPLRARMPVVWIVLGLFVAGTIAALAGPRTRSLPVALVSLTAVLVALQILMTQQATAGWHYIAVYPFVSIVAAYGAWSLAAVVLRRRGLVAISLGGLAVLTLIYNGLLLGKYFDALGREPMDSAWSPAIYSLSRDVHETNATVFTADWGIFEPLFALHPSARYSELSFALLDPRPASLRAVGQSIAATPGPKLIVEHVPGKTQFRGVNANLRTAVGDHLQLLTTVTGERGVPVYNVYSYR